MTDKKCAVLHCEKASAHKGMCRYHRTRWRMGKIGWADGVEPRPNSEFSICKDDECKDRADTAGYCYKHYAFYRRRGRGANRLRAPASLSIPDRLDWIGWTVTSSGCWEWSGPRNDAGYGTFRHQGRSLRAHRANWERWNGPIPEGLHLMHSCDNPPCVNPSHLSPGTRSENSRDSHVKNRAITHGKKKLSVDTVQKIRALWASGTMTKAEIDRKLGLKKDTTCRITTGRAFGWLTEEYLASLAANQDS